MGINLFLIEFPCKFVESTHDVFILKTKNIKNMCFGAMMFLKCYILFQLKVTMQFCYVSNQ